MPQISCNNCAQSFESKKSFVRHLVSKLCFRNIGEAAKSSSRNREEVLDYPTREIVPVQGCSGCKRFSRPGLQMYMVTHLTCHVDIGINSNQVDFVRCHVNVQYLTKMQQLKVYRGEGWFCGYFWLSNTPPILHGQSQLLSIIFILYRTIWK